MTLVLFFFYFSAKLVLPTLIFFAVFPLIQHHPKRVVKKNGQA